MNIEEYLVNELKSIPADVINEYNYKSITFSLRSVLNGLGRSFKQDFNRYFLFQNCVPYDEPEILLIHAAYWNFITNIRPVDTSEYTCVEKYLGLSDSYKSKFRRINDYFFSKCGVYIPITYKEMRRLLKANDKDLENIVKRIRRIVRGCK